MVVILATFASGYRENYQLLLPVNIFDLDTGQQSQCSWVAVLTILDVVLDLILMSPYKANVSFYIPVHSWKIYLLT